MSLTVEFYSAVPQDIVSLFAEDLNAPLDKEHWKLFRQKQQAFPRADFPPRLLFPDDLDNLCQIIHRDHPSLPSRFEDVHAQHLWDDGERTEILILLSETFSRKVAEYSEQEIEHVAYAWASTFSSEEPLSTPAYQSVLQLWNVTKDVVKNGTSLIYHLEGAPQFFEYLRYL